MITNDRQQEKESMAEFIAKKREMFLVQMSLDTKREEIRKLEEKARMKEEALRKSEQASKRTRGLVIHMLLAEGGAIARLACCQCVKSLFLLFRFFSAVSFRRDIVI